MMRTRPEVVNDRCKITFRFADSQRAGAFAPLVGELKREAAEKVVALKDGTSLMVQLLPARM
jgi:hypothetical protein